MHIPDMMGGAAGGREEYDAMGRAISALKVPTKATLERQLGSKPGRHSIVGGNRRVVGRRRRDG